MFIVKQMIVFCKVNVIPWAIASSAFHTCSQAPNLLYSCAHGHRVVMLPLTNHFCFQKHPTTCHNSVCFTCHNANASLTTIQVDPPGRFYLGYQDVPGRDHFARNSSKETGGIKSHYAALQQQEHHISVYCGQLHHGYIS